MRHWGYHEGVRHLTFPGDTFGRLSWGAALGLLLLVQLLAVNYWQHFPSPNERPRVYQALAVVHRGTLSIGPEIERWGGSEDIAVHAERLYPNKAPGMLPLLLPGAVLAHFLTPCGSEDEIEWAVVLGRFLASSLPSWIVFLLLWRRSEQGPLLAGLWALTTPALAASLLLFSHALTACLLMAAFILLERASARADVAAGILLAWAAACEYPLVLPAVVLVLAVPGRSRWRRVLWSAGGAAVPLLGLALYNAACFGSPLSLSSAHEAHQAFASLEGTGLFGVGLPGWQGIWGLLFSPERGLCSWMPLVPLGALAFLWSRDLNWHRVGAPAIASFSLLLVMAGYRNWHGGWFPGPRYLLPVVPLLMVAVVPGLAALRRSTVGRVALAALVVWGAVASWLSVAAFPFPPDDVPLPFLTLAPPLLADGISFPSRFGSGLWLVALASGCVAAVWVLVRSVTTRLGELVLAVGVAVVLLGGAHATSEMPSSWKTRLEMAVIRDLYGDGRSRGALLTLQHECSTTSQCQQVRRWIEQVNRSQQSRR